MKPGFGSAILSFKANFAPDQHRGHFYIYRYSYYHNNEQL